MKDFLRYTGVFFLGIILTSCLDASGSSIETMEHTTVAPTIQPASSPTSAAPTATMLITATVTPALEPPKLTSTERPVTEESEFFGQCWPFLDEFPSHMTSVNIVALNGSEGEDSYLWEINSTSKYLLADGVNETAYHFDVSPNGQWLSFLIIDESANQSLRISSSDGLSVFDFPWDASWYLAGQWLDNTNMLILTDEGLLSLNPFTGTIQPYDKTDLVFPDYDQLVSLWSYKVNPQQTLAVYPDESLENYILWDIINNKVATVPFPYIVDQPPVWLPSGENFIVANFTKKIDISQPFVPDYELYLVSQTGIVEQLTDFGQLFTGVNIDTLTYQVSPDGRYLAFWAEFDPPELRKTNFSLYIYFGFP